MPESEQPEQLPSVDALQFRRAQPTVTTESPESRTCAACKQLIIGQHYQVNNHVICPQCAAKVSAGQQSQKPVPLFRAVIYGVGAAVAGSILYAIPLAKGFQIGIVALLVGWMVGKAIRAGSYGMGGRPQQILAVVLTYFAISASLFPAAFFIGAMRAVEARSAAKTQPASQPPPQRVRPGLTPGRMIAGLLVVATISPFLQLRVSPVGGLISLFILFIGLQRAWALTARHEIMVTGPYS
ncbi:MAG TPA: hypothetical protein VK752_27665 [Bryobacteraceae bacterium]|jgi:hypothetical protein|nr:hypothetical protein [Bryobacteraceae bacterium]